MGDDQIRTTLRLLLCGRLGHTSPNCNDDVVMSELTPGAPIYGPWLLGVRPRSNTRWFNLGGQTRKNQQTNQRDWSKPSWKDIMDKASVIGKTRSSSNATDGGEWTKGQDQGSSSRRQEQKAKLDSNYDHKKAVTQTTTT